MKVRFDEDADALYIRLSDSRIIESEEVQPGIILDFDDESHVVGIEILRVSQHIPGFNLKQLQVDVA
ncbi:MAG TPA: DUF2283 domain-containing protein [Thermomicrobiales bacterium]|nr:DUF2283 domain-containing protein [Thermomicrobiales bacterium]